ACGQPPETQPKMRTLMALQGRPANANAARYAGKLEARMARPPRITLLTVDPPLMPGVETRLGKEAVRKYHHDNAEYALRGPRAALRRTGAAFKEQQVIALPAEEIIQACNKPKADLLARGSHGRRAAASVLLGPVAINILSTP